MPDLDRLEALFADALARPPADRPAFLDAACGPDADLRRRLDGLLAAHAAAGGFLSAPHPTAFAPGGPGDPTRTFRAGDATAPHQPPQDVAGAVVAGRYKLLEQIGEGGMGSVWMADQTDPVRRRVAVKLIRADRGGSKTILARFEAERQAIALMDHPHIAKLLDAGTTDGGQPFFVMELVKGVPLTDYCDAHTLPVPDRLELFRQICSAVQHAHQKGVIHRDLKPSNILVESHDGKPVPKVIDFGLAKATGGLPLTDHTLFTGFGSVAGTPLYMAPEQATFNAVDIDTRADVYALGVILYELLTGSTPIRRETLKRAALEEVLRVVREQEPPSPSHRLSTADARPAIAAKRQTEPAKLGRMVKGELDWIVMKALAKDRDRRYDSATGLARDVERFLNREPVSAGPPSAAYRARKFVARNRPQVVAAGTVALTLVIGLVGTSVGLARAALARAEAERERQNALAAAETEKVARQAEAEQRKAAEAQTAAANAAKAFLQSVLVQGVPRRATPGRAADPSRTLRAALDWASKDIEGRFAGQPEIAADLRGTIGEAYHGLGAYPAAEGHLRAALNLSETAHGAAHPRTLSSLQYLAELYLDQGDWRTAEVLFKRALEGLEKALGPGHPGTLGCAHGLGTVYLATGDLGSAERLLDRVLAGAEKAPGPDHPDTLTAVFHLAIVYQEKGDTGSAERLLDRVLAGREKALGPDHPDTLASVNHLAKIYLDSGEYSRAEPLLLRALDGQRRVLGPDHPLTLSSVNNLAGLYWSTGRLDRSIPLFEDTLKRQRAVLGDEHPETLRMSANLGVNYKDAGRVAEGVPLLELAYAARAKHPAQLGWVGPELVAAYVKAGRPADAARVVGEGLAEARAKVKPGSPELGNVLAMSGKRLLPLDPAAAEPVLRECLELREKLNPKAWNTANARSLLGAALLLQGKPAEAEPLLVAGYAGLLADRANIPPMPAAQANLPDAADRLVELYAALGKPDEAKRWRAERAKYPFVAPPPRPAK